MNAMFIIAMAFKNRTFWTNVKLASEPEVGTNLDGLTCKYQFSN